ncbi:MAG: Tyrosine--tRNA ligase [Methanonatronarchaeales archaeon]|nr:Tyrosine--tRNA ligase [Methanonatronarchaeales archaeon]
MWVENCCLSGIGKVCPVAAAGGSEDFIPRFPDSNAGVSREKRLELVRRNAEEIVTEGELDSLIDDGSPRAYTGYEPSGTIHLGHLVTVEKLKDLVEAGFDVTVLLADLHAYLNEKGDLDEIEEVADMNRRAFEAYGLEAEFVLGSEFQLNDGYVMDMHRLAVSTTMARAQRSMDEVSRSRDDIHVSQVVYPLMQALDIAYLDVDLAVGGTDQRKIHMLAREGLPRIGYDAPTSLHTPILTGLDGSKMSSSKQNWIDLSMSEEDVEGALNNAYCPAGTETDNPVLEIAKYLVFPEFEEVEVKRTEKYGGDVEYRGYPEVARDFESGELHPLDLKKSVSKYLNGVLAPARENFR